MPDAKPQPWTGWHKPPRGRWRSICQAEDEGSCWQLLLAQSEPGDRYVGPTGKRPDDKPARSAGRSLFSDDDAELAGDD
jgi:hypothetical protein